MSKFSLTDKLNWTDLKEFDINKYTSNRSKGYVFEVHLEYPKVLEELITQ